MFILLYHQISSIPLDKDPFHLAVPPDLFEKEMCHLKEAGYECKPVRYIAEMMSRSEPVPENYFAITFDDGYQDNLDVAYPILKRYGFTATIFVVPDRVGLPAKWDGVSEHLGFQLLGWDGIRELAGNGIDIGSHTHTHAKLADLSSDRLNWELITSKTMIERELGRQIDLFAFPYEHAEEAFHNALKKVGYFAACGSLLYPESQYNLWRTECFGSDSMNNFKYKISINWRKSVLFKYHSPLGKFLRNFRRKFKNTVKTSK